MSIIAWLVIGLLAGWLANMIMNRGEGSLIADIITGMLGAIVGGFIMGLVTGRDYINGFNLETLLVAVLGAVILIGLFRLATGKSFRA